MQILHVVHVVEDINLEVLNLVLARTAVCVPGAQLYTTRENPALAMQPIVYNSHVLKVLWKIGA